MIASFVDQLALEIGRTPARRQAQCRRKSKRRHALRHSKHPGLLVFKDGREVDRIVGAVPAAEIARRLKPWVE
jgi:hypothetical protein